MRSTPHPEPHARWIFGQPHRVRAVLELSGGFGENPRDLLPFVPSFHLACGKLDREENPPGRLSASFVPLEKLLHRRFKSFL